MASNHENGQNLPINVIDISWLWLEQNGIPDIYINNFKGELYFEC